MSTSWFSSSDSVATTSWFTDTSTSSSGIYVATSTTSLVVGMGEKTLSTQTGLAYTTGIRLRISSYDSPTLYWME
ncbi:MAG: hypothetical protein AAB966_01570, partial [Patescibacteria group bacterium]